ncbi:MAG: sulfatase-like hydrolase/transferase, partial [Acidobacteriota bacterium]
MRSARAVLLGAVVLLSGCGRKALPPIILISVDTLRADHLPAYGYRGVETPNLDALARDAVVFENAYSQVPLTLPSHAVLLTGLPPYRNGVRDNIGFHLAPAVPTLATYLKEAGYATGAAVSSLALAADRGLDRGFDLYDDRFGKESPDERAGPATVAVLEKWSKSAAGAPIFLFLHLYEPHAPYTPPEPFRARYA